MYTLEQQIIDQQAFDPFTELSQERAAVLDNVTRRRLGPCTLTALAQPDNCIDRNTLVVHLAKGMHFVDETELAGTCKSLKRYELVQDIAGSDSLTLHPDTKDTSVPLTHALQAWQLHEQQRWVEFFAPPALSQKSHTVASFAVLNTVLQCGMFVSGRAVPDSHRYGNAVRKLVSTGVLTYIEREAQYQQLVLTTESKEPASKLISGIEQAAKLTEHDVRDDMERLYKHPTWIATLVARAMA